MILAASVFKISSGKTNRQTAEKPYPRDCPSSLPLVWRMGNHRIQVSQVDRNDSVLRERGVALCTDELLLLTIYAAPI